MWLLGNLFRTEKLRLSGAPWKIFEITTDVMMSSTENYGILRGAILVAAELSDFSRSPSHLRSRPSRSDRMQVSQREPSSNVRTASKAHLKQRMFDVCSSL